MFDRGGGSPLGGEGPLGGLGSGIRVCRVAAGDDPGADLT